MARFERVAVVLSGGGALGAYQAGALAAMEGAGWHPNWLAAVSTGAFNAAIIAGSPPSERAERLRSFWQRLVPLLRRSHDTARSAGNGFFRLFRRASPGAVDTRALRALLGELIDFPRVNSGAVRLTLGAVHLPTGAETYFDNDRHILTLDHVMASAALPAGLPPVWIENEPYGTAGIAAVTALPTLLDAIPPVDTLCFIIDCFDPTLPGAPGFSRAGQQIAAYRRWHDLRRIIGLLGDKLPEELRRDPEIRRCLAHGLRATMNLVHLVHESNAIDLASKLGDFSEARVTRSWRAGERAMAASLAQPAWLAPPPRRVGVIVHELREAGDHRRIL